MLKYLIPVSVVVLTGCMNTQTYPNDQYYSATYSNSHSITGMSPSLRHPYIPPTTFPAHND
jgi:hypothetical protein